MQRQRWPLKRWGLFQNAFCFCSEDSVNGQSRDMIILYEGGGSRELELLEQSLSSEHWGRLRQSVSKLLRRRGYSYAAELLERYPFQVFAGTNTFGDQFDVLHTTVSTDEYLELADRKDDFDVKSGFEAAAKTVSELGNYIRFVAVSLANDETIPAVSQPTLRTTSDVVRAALLDAEHLIIARGALNGLDRVHTALHGYLREIANDRTINAPPDASITQLFKLVIENHPSFDNTSPRNSDIERIVRSMATIVDALNPLRNRASLAHPNDNVLAEAEAMLVVNTVRTLLQYLDAREIKKSKQSVDLLRHYDRI